MDDYADWDLYSATFDGIIESLRIDRMDVDRPSSVSLVLTIAVIVIATALLTILVMRRKKKVTPLEIAPPPQNEGAPPPMPPLEPVQRQ